MAIKLQMSRPLFLVITLTCIVILGTLLLREEAPPPLSIVTDTIIDTAPDAVADTPVTTTMTATTKGSPDVDMNDLEYWRSGKFISSHLDTHPDFNSHGVSIYSPALYKYPFSAQMLPSTVYPPNSSDTMPPFFT